MYCTDQLDLGYPFHHVHLGVSHLVDPYHPLDLGYLVDLVDLDNRHHPRRRISFYLVKKFYRNFTLGPEPPIGPG